MRAIFLNGTLKPSPAESSTAALAGFVAGCLRDEHGVETEAVRLVDESIAPGVSSEPQAEDDGWPAVRERVLAADILVMATPTWLGQPSSVTKGALERMDAFLSETDDEGVPVAYNKVAGFVVVGNEDGAHQCIALMAQALIDIGFTVPGQAWTYWNKGPGPGDEVYLTSDDREWTHETGRAMAHVLVHAARALAAHPIPKPPNA
jgi:multimeric flavodoxin WrbA